MGRHVRFYSALVLVAVWFTLAMLAALPRADAACGLTASWYGFESGNRTANGERYDPWGLTAAHRTLPFGTIVTVTYEGRSVTVRINDRGPAAWTGRDIDLSLGAATALGMVRIGVAPVCITVER
jgi:rare lipoprotein A